MRAVVSDTSPLRYLVLIGEIDVLPQLYGHLLIPPSVAAELSHPNTPALVRQWASSPPHWLEVVSVASPPPEFHWAHLGAGERDALTLALARTAALVLMDDREGVVEARKMGVSVVGTLGVLDWAAHRNLLHLPSALAKLQATNFRMSPKLLASLLTAPR
jgi:predicted nucleic acid-binding protein